MFAIMRSNLVSASEQWCDPMSRRGKRMVLLSEEQGSEQKSNVKQRRAADATTETKDTTVAPAAEEEAEARRESSSLYDEELRSNFKWIHFVLNTFHSRHLSPTLQSVQETMRKMTGRTLNFKDICMLIGICDAFVVQNDQDSSFPLHSWRQLSIRTNPNWPNDSSEAKSSHSDSVHLPIETKLAYFDNLLNLQDISAAQSRGEAMLSSLLKPQSNVMTPRRQSNSKDSLRSILQSASGSSQPAPVFMDKQRAVSLEDLKQQAVSRGTDSKKRQQEEKSIKDRLYQLSALEALPRLADALRSLAVTRNKSTFSLREAVEVLSEQAVVAEYKHQSGKQKLWSRVYILAREAPEFAQILPPDDIIQSESIRINMYTSYKAVRDKIKSIAEAAAGEKKTLLSQDSIGSEQ